MPPDSPIDLALTLKKRARRRLVGAIALVLLMLIILPNVLQDRAVNAPRETIKLTMPEVVAQDPVVNTEVIPAEALPDKLVNETDAQAPKAASEPMIKSDAEAISRQNALKVEQLAQEEKIIEEKAKIAAQKVAKEAELKKAKTQDVEKKSAQIKPADNKSVKTEASRYLIQVGVYSDEANVKQLQSKISQAGFTSRTAKLNTPKGEKIRLRVGTFITREAAADALKKLEANGLPGMVLIDD